MAYSEGSITGILEWMGPSSMIVSSNSSLRSCFSFGYLFCILLVGFVDFVGFDYFADRFCGRCFWVIRSIGNDLGLP